MKTPLTFLLSLTFLFLYPSISFSQTFKCEFISEKFKGGKSNEGSCSGDPELVYGKPRNEHCKVEDNPLFFDYKDYIVNLTEKQMIYKERFGIVGEDLKREWDYVEPYVLSIHPFTQITGKNKHNKKGDKSTSYLITYKTVLPKKVTERERMFTLYIPQHGRSVISEYHTTDINGDSSWVSMKFGKCVNTSN
jgi:hypothetical protein